MSFYYLFIALVVILTLIISYTVGLEYYLRRKQDRRNQDRRSTERRHSNLQWAGVDRRVSDRRQEERRHNLSARFA